jgi:DNA-binding SARP family transcriptional activator
MGAAICGFHVRDLFGDMILHRITTKALLRALPVPSNRPWHQRARLLAALDSGAIVSRYRLIDALWGDDPEGGPDDARTVLKQHIWKLRQLYGCEIVANYTRGYELRRNPVPGD